MRLTVPTYVWPISASAVNPRMRLTAASAAAPSAVAIETVPSSSTSIFAPVSSTSARMTLPPGPMTSRILSGLILILIMRGACGEIASRAAGSVCPITSRMNKRPFFACSSASAMICAFTPAILMSICRAVMPSRVPATLKSMSP